MVDLPFALPTAVAGIALTALYAPRGWLGGMLLELLRHPRVAFTPLGVIARTHPSIGLPFDRAHLTQPVLEELDKDHPDAAAATLGASEWQTFTRVILPSPVVWRALLCRLRAGVCAWRRRVRLRDIHRGQHAHEIRKSRRCSSSPGWSSTTTIGLTACRRGHAGVVFRADAAASTVIPGVGRSTATGGT